MSKQNEPYIDRVTAAMEIYDSIVYKMQLDREASTCILINDTRITTYPKFLYGIRHEYLVIGIETEAPEQLIRIFLDCLTEFAPMVAFIVGKSDQYWYLNDSHKSQIFEPTEIKASTFGLRYDIEYLMEIFERTPMDLIHFGHNPETWN